MPQPVESGLVLYLPFDERSGVTAWDRTRFRNHGTLTGATGLPTWVAGYRKGALSFDGVDDYVNCGDGVSLDISASITLSAWIYLNSKDRLQHIVGRDDGANRNYVLQILDTDNTLRIIIWIANVLKVAATVTALTTGRWYHCAGTYTGATLRAYINGLSGAPVAVAGAIDNDNVSLLVGIQAVTLARTVAGVIGEVRIYNKALTAAEVKRLYESGMPYAKYA